MSDTLRKLLPLTKVPEQRPWATERYLRRLVAERRIPYYKIGGRLLIDLAELDALVEQGRTEAQR